MTPSISPAKILKDLDNLWVSLGEQHDDPESGAVLRACSMTLIVAVSGPSDDVAETLAQLVRDHPARLVVLRVVEGEPHLTARVIAQCWMPFGRRQQICCEQVEITLTRSTMADIPPVLRSLIVPDLPVVMWVRDRGLLRLEEFEPVLAMADKLIVDSLGVKDPAAQVTLIRSLETGSRNVSDLSWARLTRWRETIAQIFDDPCCRDAIPQINKVQIAYQGGFIPASAFYLAAWLRNGFGREIELEFTPAPGGDRARVQTVTLLGGPRTYSITVTDDRMVEVHSAVRDSRSVFPRLSEYELMREELSVLGHDPVYEAVIAIVPELTAKYHS